MTRTSTRDRLRLCLLLACLGGSATLLRAQSNLWISAGSGKWEADANWSLGAPGAGDSIFITNAGTKTVTIDATTSGSFSNTLSVTNLTLSAPGSAVNTLLLTDAGTNTPLRVHENFVLLSGGALAVTNSGFTVDCARPPTAGENGSDVQLDGVATVNNGALNFSNAWSTTVGAAQAGSLSLTNSTFDAHVLFVGYYGQGTANFINCTSRLGYIFSLATVNYAITQAVNIVGGQFIATNTYYGPDENIIHLGDRGIARMTVSNANVRFGTTTIGQISGADGSLSFQGGTMTLGKTFLGANAENTFPTAQGSILVSGGRMSMPELHIGYQATGTVTVAAGYLSNSITILGETNGATGTLNITGGTNVISSLLQVGTNGSSGAVSITGGALLVTNASHTAAVVVNGGTLFNLGGVFVHDGDLILTNGATLVTASNYLAGSAAGSSNSVTINGSALVATNGVFGLGNDGTLTNGSGSASATVTNAALSTGSILIGSSAGGSGQLTIQNSATVSVSSNVTVVSASLGSTNALTVAGGSLNAPNGTLAIGPTGNGQMTMTGGTVTAKLVKLGGVAASGALHLLGGLLRAAGINTNFLLVGGGDLDGSGGTVIVGEDHNAEMAVASGSATNMGTLYVGYSAGFTGTFNQSGGLAQVMTNLIVGTGDCVGGAVGVATLTGGALYVTNATHTAVLDIRNGTFVLNPGATLVVDTLVLTNACGHFVNNGGTLVQNNPPNLAPNLDADGDGQSNAAEALAGTDPLNPASLLRITGAIIVNDDVQVTWTTVAGHSYVLQVCTNATGSVSSGFVDCSTTNSIGGTGEGTTSYTHTGGAIPAAAYYRVRLGP